MQKKIPFAKKHDESRAEKRLIVNTPSFSIINGDATLRKTIKRQSVDLTVTSPPYNLGMEYSGDGNDDFMTYEDYLHFSKTWLANVYHWTKNTGRLCLNIGLDKNKGGKRPTAADLTTLAMLVGWNYHATIIWNEGNISRRTAWGSWMSASAPHIIAPVEVIIILHKGNWKRLNQGDNDITGDEFKDWVKGVWNFNGEKAKRIGHEAPFPRELPKRCIKLFSFIGDTVLDPFLGSGTTIIESLANGRHGVGIEREAKYCELAKNRICAETKKETIMSQEDLIKEYYLARPNQDVKHQDAVDWAVAEWKQREGKVLRDPDRAIRKLSSSGFLQKISKGVYRCDPEYIANPKIEDFTETQKTAIKARDGNKCAVCGKTLADGVELHVDHIKPKDKGGKATLENGQVLCGEHNYKKKNYNQPETAKTLFVNLRRNADKIDDAKLKKFEEAVLKVYDEHDVNGHIEWQDE